MPFNVYGDYSSIYGPFNVYGDYSTIYVPFNVYGDYSSIYGPFNVYGDYSTIYVPFNVYGDYSTIYVPFPNSSPNNSSSSFDDYSAFYVLFNVSCDCNAIDDDGRATAAPASPCPRPHLRSCPDSSKCADSPLGQPGNGINVYCNYGTIYVPFNVPYDYNAMDDGGKASAEVSPAEIGRAAAPPAIHPRSP